MTETYLDMMEDSLYKKIEVMQQIEIQNGIQKKALERPEGPDQDAFDEAVRVKGVLIGKVTELNDGFAGLYDKIKNELDDNKDKYRDQITRMQNLIRQVTDLSNTIEVQEARNKKLIDSYFSNSKISVKSSKQSAAVSSDYRTTMNKSASVQSHFVDSQS